MIHMFSKSYCPYCKKAIAIARQYGIEPDVLQLDEIPDGQTIQKEIQESRYNKVNIDHLKEQFDAFQKKINGH